MCQTLENSSSKGWQELETLPARHFFRCGNRGQSQEARSGQYAGCGKVLVFSFARYSCTRCSLWAGVLCRHVIPPPPPSPFLCLVAPSCQISWPQEALNPCRTFQWLSLLVCTVLAAEFLLSWRKSCREPSLKSGIDEQFEDSHLLVPMLCFEISSEVYIHVWSSVTILSRCFGSQFLQILSWALEYCNLPLLFSGINMRDPFSTFL